LIWHYAAQPVNGWVLAATTGEGLTLDDDEIKCLTEISYSEVELNGNLLPLYLGLSGSDTCKWVRTLERTDS
jgi:4-hydroxy-tetrahydrodipicolinate synthase